MNSIELASCLLFRFLSSYILYLDFFLVLFNFFFLIIFAFSKPEIANIKLCSGTGDFRNFNLILIYLEVLE